ncbi:hypothetical protein [Aliikangiella sp. IMCC44359]|uniref:hypothetical protein n=1 Tax=Aliikangiella sp. IMCC44359 TaxID=3459125 RepID=UPI00403AF99A
MRKLVLLLTVVFFSSSVLAETVYFRNRTIIGAGISVVNGKSYLFINIDGDKSGMVNCSTTHRFVINSDSPSYKELVSIAMTAYASKEKNVDIIGINTCNYFSNSQDLMGIKIGNMPW